MLSSEGIEAIGVVPYVAGIRTIQGHALFGGTKFGLVLYSPVWIHFRLIPVYIRVVRIPIHYLTHHITVTKFVVTEDKGSPDKELPGCKGWDVEVVFTG